MDAKKVVVIAVLIAVIIAAAIFTMRRSASDSKPPADVAAAKSSKIDMKTYEEFTETNTDWLDKYAPDQYGRYKNPKTGTYTMVGIMKCASCGKDIPVPQIPDELRPKSVGKGVNYMANKNAMMKAQMDAVRNYKCPLCGKPASGAPGEAPAAK